MREVRDIIEHAAGVNVTVLITGETGTGKDLVARAVHELSARHGGPFVKVNCAIHPAHEQSDSARLPPSCMIGGRRSSVRSLGSWRPGGSSS
jgi:sigma54-dependent transcription regulator